MTKLLLHLFVPNASGHPAEARAAIGKLAGWVGVVCNALLFCLKLIAGLLTGSVAIVGDGINNLTDSASSAVTLVGFRMAQRPADREHPFGHGRYEYVAGVVVAALVLLAGAELAKSSVEEILQPQSHALSAAALGSLLVSVPVKLWMANFYRKLARLIHSTALEAAAQDSRNDILTTCAVLCSFLAGSLLHLPLDGLAGMGVAVFILYSGIRLAKDTVSPLIGQQADSQTVNALTQLILAHPRILGIHDLLLHDYGPGHIFASVHAEMDAGEPPLNAHDQLDHIEQEALRRLGVHLVIHCDPVPQGDAWASYRRIATDSAARIVPEAALHDLRVLDYQGQQKLSFDLAVPYSLPLSNEEILTSLTEALHQNGCTLPTEIQIDRQEG